MNNQISMMEGMQAQRHSLSRGFTLIEMVGVLAIIAILVALAMPSVIKQVDQAAWTKETADLDTIADALQRSILRTKTIPASSGIPAAVGNELGLSVDAVTNTPRRLSRAFLVDPNLRINGAVLPYTQTDSGAAPNPQSARIMIVSSLSRGLPVSTSDTLGTFDNIWATPENTVPSSWTWAGKGDDLRIKKINLEPLFHHLVLINRDTNGAARFSIDSTNSTLLPAGAFGLDAFFLDGSVAGLHDSAGVTVTKYLLNRDISFVFERGQWAGWIGPGDPYYTTADEFNLEAREFLGSNLNPKSKGGSSQTGVLVAMYVFMLDYALWAEECPHFSRHGLTGSTASIPEYQVLDAIGKNMAGGVLSDASKNILDK